MHVKVDNLQVIKKGVQIQFKKTLKNQGVIKRNIIFKKEFLFDNTIMKSNASLRVALYARVSTSDKGQDSG